MSILNREFRDYSAESMYPFEDSARMSNTDGVIIPNTLFLDALVFSLLDVSLPFYVYAIDGTKGSETEAEIVVKDKKNQIVCRGLMSSTQDTAYLYDTYGRLAGTVVYSLEEGSNMIHKAQGKTFIFSSTDLPLICGRCFVTRAKGLSVVSGGGESLSQDVYLVGANGIHFTSESGKIYVHMLGEEAITKKPIKTVNGYPIKHLWLAAHPNSAVKVETKSGTLKLWNIKDTQ
jgi:hypothetical protein